jgi:hypothetical protein
VQELFTEAAIERIAECCTKPTGGKSAVETILTERIEIDFEVLAEIQSGIGQKQALDFYTFAGLLELAASAGYIDLAAWKALPIFKEALQQALKEELVKPEGATSFLSVVTDVALMRELHHG